MAKKPQTAPQTRLKIKELLGDLPAHQLSEAMGLKYYNQIYPYLDDDKRPNPTLLMLETIAKGLSKLRKEDVPVTALLDEKRKKTK